MITTIIIHKCINESKKYVLSRSEERIKLYGEVFTPTQIVLEMLEQLPKEIWLPNKTYLDPTCGNGQFLAPVLLIKLELGHESPLKTIYGVDLMQDNVDECRQRLIDIVGNTEDNWNIVKNNIRCENGLMYDYQFGEKTTFDNLFEIN